MFPLMNKIIIHTFYSTENFFVRIYYTIGKFIVIVISIFLYVTLILLGFLKLYQWFVTA